MSGVSDAHVIGVLVFLVLGAVSYYFYSRMNNLERKVGLMENILFDLKVTTEQALQVMSDPTTTFPSAEVKKESPRRTSDESEDDQTDYFASRSDGETREVVVDSSPRARVPSQPIQVERKDVDVVSTTSTTPNYEAMTYKELVAIARQKSISGLRTMSKAQVIEALRGRETGAKKSVDISSWMQDTTPLQDDGQDAIDSQELGPSDMNGTLLTPEESDEVEASLVSS